MRKCYWTAPDCYLGLVSPHNSFCWRFLSPEPNWWGVIWTSGQAPWIKSGSSISHKRFLFPEISKQQILFCWRLEDMKGFSSTHLVVQSLSRVQLFENVAWQASLSFTISWSLFKLMLEQTLSWWCHLTTSSSVIPFSSCSQSYPASGSFPHTYSKENASVLPCLWTKANCTAHLQFMLPSRSGV